MQSVKKGNLNINLVIFSSDPVCIAHYLPNAYIGVTLFFEGVFSS